VNLVALHEDPIDFLSEACQRLTYGQCIDASSFSAQRAWPLLLEAAKKLSIHQSSESNTQLLCSKREPDDLWPKWLTHADYEPWHALFAKCFGHTMVSDFWHWKYRDTKCIGLGLYQQDKLVAFYGEMPRDIYFKGKKISALQMGDVMVDPAFRQSTKLGGAFQFLCSLYFDFCFKRNVGVNIGFGFPNRRAFRVAQLMGFYKAVDAMSELSWSGSTSKQEFWFHCKKISWDTAARLSERLWPAMQRSLQECAIAVRDQAYINARYKNHPSQSYECLVVENRCLFRGIALIVYKTSALNAHEIEILDIITEKQNFQVAIKCLRQFMQRSSINKAHFWLTQSQLFHFNNTEAAVKDLDIVIPRNSWRNDDEGALVNNKWWLTAGDSDSR
jgi:hypothetical protein